VMFIILGQSQLEGVGGVLGYVHGPAWIAISITSVLFAPLGAALTQKIAMRRLQQGFAAFLVIVAANLLIG